jgi:very-short-patch-repair endonuclease
LEAAVRRTLAARGLLDGPETGRKVPTAEEPSEALARARARKAGEGKSESVEVLLGQLARAGAPPPVREHRPIPGRRYACDLAFPAELLAVEVDGGAWIPGGGRHSRGKGFENDAEKASLLAGLGWRVVRGTTGQVKRGEVARWVLAALAYRRPGNVAT